MLLNHQQRKILELLCKTEHVTASELAGQLGIGVKTVRVRIKELNPELEKKGIQILSKSRYGYYLDPRQPEGIEGLLNPKENEDPVIPSNNQERVHFLLAYLLNRTEYIKSEELCDFLYISKGTLTNTLRQVEETYQKYGISVHKKPGYGIRVEGSEFNLRQCMVDVFVKQDSLEGIGRRHQTDEIETLGKMVYQCLKKYEIELSEIAYNDFVEHIYVAMRRIRQEKYVEPQAADMLGRKEKQFVEELTELVGAHYQIRFSQDEKNYLTLQLVGRKDQLACGYSTMPCDRACRSAELCRIHKNGKCGSGSDRSRSYCCVQSFQKTCRYECDLWKTWKPAVPDISSSIVVGSICRSSAYGDSVKLQTCYYKS